MSQQIDTIAKNYLSKILELKPNIFSEFLFAYPGICTDYQTNPNLKDLVISTIPWRDVAPCIIESLTIKSPGKYLGSKDEWMKCNIDHPEHVNGLELLGSLSTERIACPDGIKGCEVKHARTMIKYTETTNLHRQKFNQNILKYHDILELWKKFYDYRIQLLIETEYQQNFKKQLHLFLKNQIITESVILKQIDEILAHHPDYSFKYIRKKYELK